MDGIEIAVDRVGTLKDIILFRVRGYVDTTTSPELQRTLAQSIEGGIYQFIVDLGAVNYVSSAGWGVFVGEIRGLREKGGDLKIIQMTHEVFEVFEMLEFNRILTCYDSLEEAIDDYDFCRGLDLKSCYNISTVNSETVAKSKTDVVLEDPTSLVHPPRREAGSYRPSMSTRHSHVDDVDLPLTEKIKKLTIENPHMGIWSIKKQLNSPRFGYTKIRYFKLRALMKRMGLETKAKRYRFYRSR